MKFLSLAALVASASLARSAFADDKQACIDANSEGQKLRLSGKLAQARDQFVTCARELCPAIIRKDCADLLTEVEHNQPSIVVKVGDRGRDTPDVELFIDGKLLSRRLTGQGVTVDPGEHELRVRAPDGRQATAKTLVHVAEKNREMVLALPPPDSRPTVLPTTKPRADQEPARSIPTSVYVAGAVGAVALGSFAYFGISTLRKKEDLLNRCAPGCTRSEVDDLHRRALVADFSLGIAAAAIVTGIVLYFVEPDANARREVVRARQHGLSFSF